MRYFSLAVVVAAFAAPSLSYVGGTDPTPQFKAHEIFSVTPSYDSALYLSNLTLPPGNFELFNPRFAEDGQELFEGDIVLTEKQRRDRKAASNLWPGGRVKFAITSSSARDRAVILAAVNHWRQRTCLSFTEVSASFSGQPHIRFVKKRGCWSYVGRIPWNRGQEISIGSGCAVLGIVAHEIGHAVGFFHEQSRPDRDSHISILWRNIPSAYRGQFGKARSSRTFGVPYDLTSLMHYGSFAFTSNANPTIITRNIYHNQLIGQRSGLSFRDVHVANRMYNCAARCSSPPICQNGGFVGKTCQCVCPPNTSGSTCGTLRRSYYPPATGRFSITSPGTITSQNWPSLYRPGTTFYWTITAPAGRRVRLRFTSFRILPSYRQVCIWDTVYLFTNGDHIPDFSLCGTAGRGRTYTSTGNRMVMRMTAYAGGSFPSYQDGFVATVTFL